MAPVEVETLSGTGGWEEGEPILFELVKLAS